MGHIHHGLYRDAAIGLQNARLHALSHVGGGVANVYLSHRNVVLAAVERSRFGQACDRVFGGCVGHRVGARCGG